MSILAFFSRQLRRRPGGTGDLPAGANLKLDIVHKGTYRNSAQRQSITRPDLHPWPGDNRIAFLQA